MSQPNESVSAGAAEKPGRPHGWANAANYLKVARIDHWFKNIFVLAGVAAALLYMTTTRPEHSLAGKVANAAELRAAERISFPIRNPRELESAAERLYVELDHQPLITSVLTHWQVYVYAIVALLLTSFVASFNYIINEILDARRDALHPEKKHRPVPSGLVNKHVLRIMAIGFLLAGLGGSFLISKSLKLFYALSALFVMGLVYNVRPLRTKDVPYLDVITESVNNPIRLMIGWYAMIAALYAIRQSPDVWPDAGYVVHKSSFCPLSVLMAWWTMGAFLMTAKRFAEYRFIGSHEVASAYRRSFRFYSEEKLLIAMIAYISLFMHSFGVMAIRYNLNLILAVPLLVIFIAWFFRLAFQEDSPVREPEKLLRNKKFMLFCLAMFVLLIALSVLPMRNFWNWVHNMMGGDPFHPKSIAT